MKKFRKRGQKAPSGGDAAIVVILMALFLILYILFLPPEDRNRLLEDGGVEIEGNTFSNKTLLVTSVGRLDFVNPQGEDHQIPGISLFAQTNAQVLEELQPFTVKNGWFSKQEYETLFTLEDLENTDNVLLSFNAPVREGNLLITLNGKTMLDYAVTSTTPDAITLRKSDLQKINKLVFSVSGVGIKFWSTNEYQIQGAKIVGEITDLSRQQASGSFTLSKREKENLESAQFTFYPKCQQDDAGTLEINLNGRELFLGVPTCGSTNTVEVDPRELEQGKNTLTFSTEGGDYRIDRIKMDTDLEEAGSFVEYFEITRTTFDQLRDTRRPVILKITFVDDGERKRGEININGHIDFINQRDPVYEENIITHIGRGNNYIEIRPETTLNIVQLEITVQ